MKLKTLIRQASYIYIYSVAAAILFSVPYKTYAEDIFEKPNVFPSAGSGLSYKDKENFTNNGSNIPDYSKSIKITELPFIAPSNGIFVVYGQNTNYQININGYFGTLGTSYIYMHGGTWAIIGKNDIITVSLPYNHGEVSRTMFFTPFK